MDLIINMDKIVKKMIDKLKTFKEVEALALGGSYARGVGDKYSDVDIYVFYNRNRTAEKKREKALHNLAEFEKAISADFIDLFIFRGKLIHTWWADIKKLKVDLKKDDTYYKVLVKKSKLLWDRSGNFIELRKSVKFPTELAKKICTEERTLSSVPVIFRDIVEKSVYRKRP